VPVDDAAVREIIERLLNVTPLGLGVGMLVGLTAVFFGWKLLRAYIVTIGASSGAWLASLIPLEGYARPVVIIVIAVAAGILAWFFYKALVFFLAGLMGGMLAFVASTAMVTDSVWPVYLACGVGFATMGVLASVLLKPVSTAMMALAGSLLTMDAVLILAAKMNPAFRNALLDADVRIAIGATLGTLVLACVGCAYQLAPAPKKEEPS